jgi:sporulation protein YlmC with PRC-barrel domain
MELLLKGMSMSDTRLLTNTGLYRVTQLLGSRVENPRGDYLGKVEDIIIDLATSQTAAVIISMGSETKSQDRLVAVPMAGLGYDPIERKCLLIADKETLKQAPSFRSDEWPELIDRVWAADVYSHFGFLPYWQ